MSYEEFFRHATDGLTPYPWQVEVANNGLPEVLSVPTGLGKTEGTALAWAYRLLRMEDTGEAIRQRARCKNYSRSTHFA
jgi:CRISPR-associated endonuclease/helicase Cas3